MKQFISNISKKNSPFPMTRCASSFPISPTNRYKIREISAKFRSHSPRKGKPNLYFNNNSLVQKGYSSFYNNSTYTHRRSVSNISQNANGNKVYSELIEKEKETLSQKKKIKGKLIKMLKSKIVLNKKMYGDCDEFFHPEEEMARRKKKGEKLLQRHKKYTLNQNFRQIKLKITPDLFSNVKVSFRYEDFYQSPEEIILNNFTKEEIKLIKQSPKYFSLDKPPFKGSRLNLISTLKDIINEEERIEQEKNKSKSCHSSLKQNSYIYEDIYHKQNKLSKNQKKKQKRKSMDISSSKEKKKQSTNASMILKNRNVLCHSAINITNKSEMSIFTKNNFYNPNLFSCMEYDKIFEEIQNRKKQTILHRQENIKYKKEKFEALKNIHIRHLNKSNEEMFEARKVIKQLEKVYLHHKNVY